MGQPHRRLSSTLHAVLTARPAVTRLGCAVAALALVVVVALVPAAGARGHRSPSRGGQLGKLRPLVRAGARPLSQAAAGSLPSGREIVGRRTATSRTWQTHDGRMVTRVYGEPVNFRDAGGAWSPIDDRFAAASRPGYAFVNRANRYRVAIPTRLGRTPVTVSAAGGTVAFRLLGAGGHAAASGASARFANAFPGVTAEYVAEPQNVKENLRLATAQAQASYRYALKLSRGLRALQNRSGGIDVVDRHGKRRFSFVAPFAYDRAGAQIASGHGISLRLIHGRAGLAMRLAVDPRWLRAADRRYPVVIDPGVNVADNRDCYIVGGSSASTNFCGTTDMKIGWDGTKAYRTLLRFDVQAAIPANSIVEGAHMTMRLNSKTGANQAAMDAYAVTRSWTASTTWNTSDGTTAWTTAGGDYASTPAYHLAQDTGTPGTWDTFALSQLTQNWLDSTTANNGVLLKVTDETVNNVMTYNSATPSSTAPYLQVDWQPKYLGDEAWYPMADRTQLTDRSSMAVNAANGNLVVHSRDMAIAGVGLGFAAERIYNGLNPDMNNWGYGWSLNAGWDQWLDIYNDAVSFYDGGHASFRFTKNSSGGYDAPAGIDASLVHNGDGTWTVTYNKSGTKLDFTSDGYQLKSITDKNGNAIAFTYRADGHIDYATDSEGRRITFGYDSGSWTARINSITDPTTRSASYTYYPTAGALKTFTDGAGKTTTYSYDSSTRLTQISDGAGNITQFTYDSSCRVATIKRITNNTTMAGDTTTFTYNAGNTVVTDPLGKTTTFYYDSSGRETDAVDANGHHHSQTWNGDNQPVNYTSPNNQSNGQFDHNVYDAKNNLQENDAPGNSPTAGAQSRWGFNLSGTHPYFPDSATNPQGQTLLFHYDSTAAAPNLTSVGQNLGGGSTETTLASYSYDSTRKGQVNSSTDQNGHTTTYHYDANHVLDTITPPIPQGATTLGHDTLSRITTVQDGLLQTTTYHYDGDDRISRIDYPDSSYVTYTYDGAGNVTQVYDSNGAATESYSYDHKNRLTSDSGATGNDTYGYDAADHRTSLTDGGGTVSYAYDAVGNVCWAYLGSSSNACTSPPTGAIGFSYDANDNRTHTTYPGSVDMSQVWDNADRLKEIKAVRASSTLTDFTYSYTDVSGTDRDRRSSVLDAASNKTSYSYEPDRGWLTEALTKASGGSGATVADYKYDYDKNGNLLHRSNAAGTSWTTYGYDNANELCWSVAGNISTTGCGTTPTGATTFSYDADGQQTGQSGRGTIAWNKRHQATSVFGTTMGYLATSNALRLSDGTASFKYNALGLGTKTDGTATSYYTRDPSGQLLADRTPGGSYSYILDGLGSVVALTDSSGNIAKTYSYDPYGTVTPGTGTVDNPWQYAAGYADSSAGTVKFGARYYDPSIARWTQTDPIDAVGIQQGNRYFYAGGDPGNGTDSTGLYPAGGPRTNANNGWNAVRSVRAQERRNAVQDRELVCAFTTGVGAAVGARAGGYVGAGVGAAVGYKVCRWIA